MNYVMTIFTMKSDPFKLEKVSKFYSQSKYFQETINHSTFRLLVQLYKKSVYDTMALFYSCSNSLHLVMIFQFHGYSEVIYGKRK